MSLVTTLPVFRRRNGGRQSGQSFGYRLVANNVHWGVGRLTNHFDRVFFEWNAKGMLVRWREGWNRWSLAFARLKSNHMRDMLGLLSKRRVCSAKSGVQDVNVT